jgi:hypothetical protein
VTGKSLVVGIVGIAAVAAAGGGAYLALRMNASDAMTAVVSPPTPAAPVSVATPVETETTVAPVAPPAAAKPRAARPAPAKTDRAAETVPVDRPSAVPVPVPADPPTAPPDLPATSAAPPVESVPPPIPAVERAPIPELAIPQFEEVTIGEDAVIGIRLDQSVSSSNAKVEDRVSARVSRDLTVNGRTAVSSGARLEGVVTTVERGGKMRDRARIGIRFNTLILTNNTRVPIQTAVIFRDGESPAGEAGAKIGASAVVGAILGAVIGGKKGAAIGTAAGAAGGTAAVMAGDENAAVMPAGSMLTVRLTAPVTIIIDRDPSP